MTRFWANYLDMLLYQSGQATSLADCGMSAYSRYLINVTDSLIGRINQLHRKIGETSVLLVHILRFLELPLDFTKMCFRIASAVHRKVRDRERREARPRSHGSKLIRSREVGPVLVSHLLPWDGTCQRFPQAVGRWPMDMQGV